LFAVFSFFFSHTFFFFPHCVSSLASLFKMSQPSTPTKEEPQVTLSSGKGTGNVDAAWTFLDQNREAAGASEDVDIDKMRRKIDWHIVPLMFCCYTMQFLDKVILNVSAPTLPTLQTLSNDRRYSTPPSWVFTKISNFKETTSPTLLPSYSSVFSASRSPTVRAPAPPPMIIIDKF
jgi:hypothetical protein